ncbi:epoxyqueuosine reductase [Natronobacillus azotifigens]|uniref:tRNA epoxyqueuosine(34) reductase QueG n=1 Tax=Natronobacillus azotifigens TaxID=472978 RepID=A0A9J6R9Z9_9BACI|nr:tRNA epoxyqueuosine(34) reductase QueG [Natronobacillus azotifigens]MCZ0702089.1 tRNA epoxyqueuosine(34) reductase QueG [Natronobacillus azotifigens]
MAYEELKQEIIEYSKKIGIDKIGFAAANEFSEMKSRLKLQQEAGYQSGFEKGTIEERTEPELLLSDAQSIIAIAVAYPSRMKSRPKNKKGERRGNFCRASWGMDYHHVLNEKLDKLSAFIATKISGFHYRSMVDTGELSDRAVAERAGIGFSGKNCAIITPEFGSYVYLGEMITNIPFPPDTPVDDSCGDCTICIDSCPTGALVAPGRLNAQNCIAFVTQTKGFVPDEYREVMGNQLYGFDTCQLVCPRNKQVDTHLHPELEPDPELVKPKLLPLLSITNREFKEQFGTMAGSWRGKKPIQRNAIIALAHYKEESAVDELIRLMKTDPRPVIRGTAAWAIGKIGTDDGFPAIVRAKEKESDPEVINEMNKGLAFQNK